MLWCVIYGPKRLLLLSEWFYMLWCVIYGPKRLLLLSELFYMLWCVIYGPPCIFILHFDDHKNEIVLVMKEEEIKTVVSESVSEKKKFLVSVVELH